MWLTVLNIGLRRRRLTVALLFKKVSSAITPTLVPNIVTGRSISGRELPCRMIHGSPIITSMDGSGYIAFQAKSTAGHTQTGVSFIMIWEKFSLASLVLVDLVKQTVKAAENLNIIADEFRPCMFSVFEHKMDSSSITKLHIAKNGLCWTGSFDEFHVISCPANSEDFNPIQHIWDVMERQLRAQELLCRDIPDQRVRY